MKKIGVVSSPRHPPLPLQSSPEDIFGTLFQIQLNRREKVREIAKEGIAKHEFALEQEVQRELDIIWEKAFHALV